MGDQLLADDIGGRLTRFFVDEQDTNRCSSRYRLKRSPAVVHRQQTTHSRSTRSVLVSYAHPRLRGRSPRQHRHPRPAHRSMQPSCRRERRHRSCTGTLHEEPLDRAGLRNKTAIGHCSRRSRPGPLHCRAHLGEPRIGHAIEAAVMLFRTSNQRAAEVELTRRNIPFVKFGGLKFLDAAHIKDT